MSSSAFSNAIPLRLALPSSLAGSQPASEDFNPNPSPRIQPDDLQVPIPSFKLPSLELVRADIQKLVECKLRSGARSFGPIYVASPDSAQERIGPLPEPLAWKALLSNLFHFSDWVDFRDVPDDAMEAVIFALQIQVKIFVETPDDLLRKLQIFGATEIMTDARYTKLTNARTKLGNLFIGSRINRPEQALEQLREIIPEHQQYLQFLNHPKQNIPWMHAPGFYCDFADALVFTNHFDAETKLVLERVLESCAQESTPDLGSVVLRARIHLALVLQQMGVEPQQQREHTEWAAKWIRKHPSLKLGVQHYIRRRDEPCPHPVFLALRPEWFEERPTTARQDYLTSKRCMICGVTDAQRTLFRCSRCGHTYYCSKECQKLDWPLHKGSCGDLAKIKENAEALKQEGNSSAAKQAEEVIKWRDINHYANYEGLAHALGIHRDRSRGRTHIVFRKLEYTPHASRDIRHRFRVAECGVFNIDDVLQDIEEMMGLDKGEGKVYIEEALSQADAVESRRKIGNIPLIDLSFGDGICVFLQHGEYPLLNFYYFGLAVQSLNSPLYDPQAVSPKAVSGSIHTTQTGEKRPTWETPRSRCLCYAAVHQTWSTYSRFHCDATAGTSNPEVFASTQWSGETSQNVHNHDMNSKP